MRRGRVLRLPVTALAVGVMIGTAAMVGCGVSKPGLSNGALSACFRAIPPATAAVHEKSAHMIGVHRVSPDQVAAYFPPDQEPPVSDMDTPTCAVVFQGHFAPGQVSGAPPEQQGMYAVVLVSSRKLQLIAAFVVSEVPKRLGPRLV